MHFCINNHQYLIRVKNKVQSLAGLAKKQDNLNFNSSILQTTEKENILKRDDILENIDITDITDLKYHISEEKPSTVII